MHRIDTFRAFPKKYCIGRFADVTLGAKVNCVTINTRGFVVDRAVIVTLIEFFNNTNAILNFERIAMHCGLSRVILLLASKLASMFSQQFVRLDNRVYTPNDLALNFHKGKNLVFQL